MDSESLNVKKNTPSVELAIFAVNTIYNPNEPPDWIHVKVLPFLEANGRIKLLVKVSNPLFDPLPPVKIILTLRPLEFDLKHGGRDKITSYIRENIIVDSLPESAKVEYELFPKNQSGLLQIPLSLTVDCLPDFDSNDCNDWHPLPLYSTVLTDFDLLLNTVELNAIKVYPIPLTSQTINSALDISVEQAIKLVLKEMKDITEADILESVLHYKLSKDKKLVSGYVYMDNTLIELKITAERIVPRFSNAVFRIKIYTNEELKDANAMLHCQLRKKIMILLTENLLPIQKSSRPTTIIWKPRASEPQIFDFAYVQE